MAEGGNRDDGAELLAAAARKRASSTSVLPRSALDGVRPGPRGPFTAWNIAAVGTGLLLIIGSLVSLGWTPHVQRFSAVTVRFQGGPTVPEAEIIALVRRFPFRSQLSQPNEWVLHQLAEYLKGWNAVADVPMVRLVHQRGPVMVVRKDRNGRPVRGTMEGIRRVLEISLVLREPYLPGVLEDGTRVWLDREGRILPGILPRPDVPRPVVRSLRAGGTEALKSAAKIWTLLEPQVERGLIAEINLSDTLDAPAPPPPAAGTVPAPVPPAARGIVLRTRTGGRIVWGAPGEERYGVSMEDKAANLVHTLRCQGDLTRLAMVNVRFREPYYTVR